MDSIHQIKGRLMKRGKIIDADFEMVDNGVHITKTDRKISLGQAWYIFCISLLALAFFSIALPLLFLALMALFYVLKSIFVG
ncbi:hypothetical protein B0T45_06010 [Chromobacterium haemolyticum]|uniref:Uncharacterized protein n=1 Tax=Chromobacterium haemolyticum TaxID=394935 RepID=A0A1W0D5R3_9NEIS|nr:hypothetical protein B0T45_06010 [Chromobacterium haemolyticum]